MYRGSKPICIVRRYFDLKKLEQILACPNLKSAVGSWEEWFSVLRGCSFGANEDESDSAQGEDVRGELNEAEDGEASQLPRPQRSPTGEDDLRPLRWTWQKHDPAITVNSPCVVDVRYLLAAHWLARQIADRLQRSQKRE